MNRLLVLLRCRPAFMTLLAFALVPASAYGWSDAGHKIVASIAFRQLTPAEQQKVVAILEAHPRFEADFVKRMPAEIAKAPDALRHESLFQQAAVWPDMARGFAEPLKEQFHRSTWHFINLPLFLRPADERALKDRLTVNVSLDVPPLDAPDEAKRAMNVIQAIRHARKLLAAPDAAKADKALMLAWLFHLVGDVHQPLHSSAMFSRGAFPEGDRGGNGILTRQRGNLHRLWDQFLGESLNLANARKKALALLDAPGTEALGMAAAGNLDEAVWLAESHKLAAEVAYDADVMAHLRVVERAGDPKKVEPLNLPETYLKTAGREAGNRAVQAGFRLAAVLKALVAE
jgi:hypothetical protein